MRKRLRLLVVAPILLGVLVTSVLVLTLRQPSARATSNTQEPQSGPKSSGVAGPVKPPPPQDMKSVFASGSINSPRVKMTPQGLLIAARASIMDVRPESRFFWGCRVYSTGASKALVFEKLYLDQTFQLPDSHKMEPTLDDILVFPADAGKYRVEMIVFTIPPGLDLTSFRDSKAKDTYNFVSCSRSVVIP
jgi:hypothetical protein